MLGVSDWNRDHQYELGGDELMFVYILISIYPYRNSRAKTSGHVVMWLKTSEN